MSPQWKFGPCFECGAWIEDPNDPRVAIVSGEYLCPDCAPHESCSGDGCEECGWSGREAEAGL